ncbi:MAG: hypothetical protein SPJ17_00605 [Anaeroplasma sp.]|uniref:type IV toxin-antitoxin system AbiEi family antitoxin domain-containing protein n=1 Tax=Anaeroplasma sp. TaxID=1872523 RepID=UPI002A91FF2B|nr:hypothetical protein [Anaeroplasma sp.]MDY5982191.1 hypothetical protein [Anaeroplasma sp.]
MLEYIPYCFSKKDIIDNFKDKTQFDNWLRTKIKNGVIKKIHNGLYVTVDSMKNINATKYEIACKISDSAFLCYHSALEYYGLANQVFNELVVGSITRFNHFEFDGINYFCKQTNHQFEINNLINEKIKVTSIERTLIDCIDDIDLAGGIEEVLNALENIKGLSENKIMNILANYNKVILYQKVGYIFEQYNDYLKLSASFFDHLQEHLTNQVKYFLNDDYNNVEYNAKWKVIAPRNLRNKLREGL